jgi:hypothetical protein
MLQRDPQMLKETLKLKEIDHNRKELALKEVDHV